MQKLYNLSEQTIVTLFLLILSGYVFAANAAPPANDNFAYAEQLSGIQVHISRTNIEATKETGEPNHVGNIGGKSVWFVWTAPATRTMLLTNNRSNLDSLLAVYTGSSLGALTTIHWRMNCDTPVISTAR